MSKEHPLVEAVRLKQKAKRAKAHPRIIENIQKRITEITKTTMNTMRKSEYISSVLDGK